MGTTRTEISSIGKENFIDRLFENTGYTNERTIRLSEKGECCTSHKILLEGVNFDLVYTPLKHLGYKAALCALGEIYALLRQPVSLSLNLGLSSRFSVEDVTDLWSGFVVKRFNCMYINKIYIYVLCLEDFSRLDRLPNKMSGSNYSDIGSLVKM
jgi:thiamine monophosphate kinase